MPHSLLSWQIWVSVGQATAMKAWTEIEVVFSSITVLERLQLRLLLHPDLWLRAQVSRVLAGVGMGGHRRGSHPRDEGRSERRPTA